MKKFNQGSQEWLDYRRTKIGASDSPIIMELSPWSSPLELWRQKIGLEDQPVMTYAMSRGRDLEEPARQAFEKLMGIQVFPDVVEHPDYDFMMASLDGISLDGKIMVEIKSGKHSFNLATSGKIPDYYVCQMQHQMACTGLDGMYYFCFDGEDGITMEVERNEMIIEQIIEKDREFFRRIQELDPPKKKHVIKDDIQWKNYKERYFRLLELEKRIKAEKEALRKEIIESSEGNNCTGYGLQLTKSVSRGKIDYTSIPEIKSLDLEKYRNPPKEVWTITCKDC